MNALIPLPIIVPLLGAALCMILAQVRWAQRTVSLLALSSNVVVAIILLVRVDDDGIVVTQAGGWPAPLGITLVVDRLSAVMLVVSSLMLLSVLVYAIGQGAEESRYAAFNPVYLVLAAGVSASFITGDLFNLFVAFEMMLVASYVLLTLGGRPDQVRAGMSYVVISLVASTFFVTALAVIYAATGTVNMAQLSQRMPDLPIGVSTGFSLLLILVFGIKAGLFPLFFWLPDSYPTASGAITAVFAGLLTKVGVYAIIRTQTLIFPPDAQQGTVLLVLAGLTMLVGVLGALAQDDLRRMLSFHIVSHIGYMIFGLALFTLAGVAGAVFYVVHHIVVKTALFLVAGLVVASLGIGPVVAHRRSRAQCADARRALRPAGAEHRRHPAVLRVRRQVRTRQRRHRCRGLVDRGCQPGRQPADGVRDGADLVERVLGRTRGPGGRRLDRVRRQPSAACDDRCRGGGRRDDGRADGVRRAALQLRRADRGRVARTRGICRVGARR